MKNKIYLIFIFFMLFFTSSYVLSQNENKLTNDQLIDVYFNILKKLNLRGIDVNNISRSELRIKFRQDDYDMRKQIADIQCLNALHMRLDFYKERIIYCYNNFAGREKEKNIHNGADKPTKSKEEILKEAEKYLKLINGELPKNAFLGGIQFVIQGWFDSDHSYDGEWFIWWDRKEGEYKYKEDSIAIAITEKNGLLSYGYYFFSDYHPPKEIKVSKDQAVQTAKKNVNKIIRSPFFEGVFLAYKVGKYDSVELAIVNPNYVHNKKRNDNLYPNPYARLAWVVRFECNSTRNGLPSGLCEAWIDAETGEVLGGQGTEKSRESQF